jgi:preprotein translocase subunit SecG
VLTRTTTVLGALFLVLSLALALINRTPGASGVEVEGRKLSEDVDNDWWQDQEAAPGDAGGTSIEGFDVQDLFIQDPATPVEPVETSEALETTETLQASQE